MEQQGPPPALVEWTDALQAYVDACAADTVTQSMRVRVRMAWLAIKDNPGFEPSPKAFELMDEVMRPLH